MRNIDRFRGCLVGGAAGDALGYAVEFIKERKIFSRYGKSGITEYDLRDGAAEISDDTQMTLFTATGLLARDARGTAGDGADQYEGWIWKSYRDWMRTQREKYPLAGEKRSSWLANVPGMFQWRAPGNTCLSALGSGEAGSVEKPLNQSKGCGSVMRVAPVGLYFNDTGKDVREIARLGAEAAALTHGHILGWMPAAALTQIVHEVSQDDVSIPEAVAHALDTAEEMWPETKERAYFTDLIRKAADLASGDTEDLRAIHRLGEGWVGEEALAIAVFCAVRYADDFDRALIAAVNHNGDSDSTGAVAGNILGAKLGLSGIPEKYTENLELKDIILEVAGDLYSGNPARNGPEDPVWARKYIDGTYPGPEQNRE